MVAMATDGLTRVYGVPGRTASVVRRFGMGLIDRIAPIKERLMAEAGVPADEAQPALAALAAGAVENVAARGPAEALTGPVARGDAATVRRHLARLSGADRDLYCLLGREALKLAEARGLDPAAAARLRDLLGEER